MSVLYTKLFMAYTVGLGLISLTSTVYTAGFAWPTSMAVWLHMTYSILYWPHVAHVLVFLQLAQYGRTL